MNLRALLLLAGLLAGACSGTEVRIEEAPEADLRSLQSFAWMPAPPAESGLDWLDAPAFQDRLRARVEEALVERGYRKASGAADFRVACAVSFEQRISIATINNRYAMGAGLSWEYGHGREQALDSVVEEGFEEGILYLNLLDPAGERPLWRGVCQSRLSMDATQAEIEALFDDAVARLVGELPAR